MHPHITVITLAVQDLNAAYQFYHHGLGLASQGIIGTEFEYGAVAFFDLQQGLKLALWPQNSLSHDTGLVATAFCSTQMSLGHNVASPAEVDQLMQQAIQAGAKAIKPAQHTFYGGYAGYFQDLDGHLWEITYNPQFD
ncbi:MAG: VOC family protein [Acinetobacter sp.]